MIHAVRAAIHGPSGDVAWASRERPYAAGLAFDDALVGESARFLEALLGPVTLVNAPPRAS